MLKISSLLIIIFCLLIAEPVYAYLDPGTGSAILQGVLAGLAALAVMGKLYWHRLLRLFGLKKPDTEDSDQDKLED